MPNNFGVDVLKNTMDNPARSYLWDVIIPRPVGGGDRDAFQTRCQSATLPGRSVGTIAIPYKQTPGIVIPGKAKVPHLWKATFIESADRKIFDFLYAWAQSLVNTKTGVGMGDGLAKTDLYMSLSSVAAQEYLRLRMMGVFFTEVGDIDLSYESEGILTFSTTFSYDDWEKAI
jgi:hypothetical protein